MFAAKEWLRLSNRSKLSCASYCTVSCTIVRPEDPIARAPAGVRSIIRPLMYGPRSLMRTTTDCPVLTLVTLTFVPKGRVCELRSTRKRVRTRHWRFFLRYRQTRSPSLKTPSAAKTMRPLLPR